MRTLRTLLCITLASACSAPPPRETTAPPPSASPAERAAPAIDAQLARARATLDDGRPRDALTELDELARTAPGDVRVWLLRGEACLATARDDAEPNFYYVDALNAFERALELGAGRDALIGASRAARMQLDADKALDYAHRATEGVAELDDETARVAIEAAFDVYIAQRNAQQDASAIHEETQSRLFDLLARSPDDPWALLTLANLFQWEGRDDAAVEPIAHLLDVAPRDEAVHNRFVALLRKAEGSEAVVAFYDAFAARHPDLGLGEWYGAQELFEQATNELYAQQDSGAKFAQAEQLFAACRESAPSYEQACRGFEVMCRDGAGWCRFNAGDLAGAERAFLSMEEVLPGGLQWQIEGRLLSGVQGLQLIADRALREGGESSGIAKAASIYERLHALVPNDASIANNAGFFHRELGVAHVDRWSELVAGTEREPGAPTAEEARSRALEEGRAALRALETSRDAYLDAAKLAPSDVRIQNDAALILVYHFPSRADEAEQLLERAVQLGAEQKDDPALDDRARDALLEAWGDAHQNLGVLELVIRKRPDRARPWFEKSVAIGPLPRVDRGWITGVALPMCERAAQGAPIDPRELDPRIWWAAEEKSDF